MVVTITSTFSFFCVGTFHGRVTGRNKHEFLPFSVYRSQSITNLYSPKTWLQETLGAPYKLRHINRPLPEDHLNQLVLMISHVTSTLAVDPIGQCLTGCSQKIRRTCLSFGTSHSEVELLTSLSWCSLLENSRMQVVPRPVVLIVYTMTVILTAVLRCL